MENKKLLTAFAIFLPINITVILLLLLLFGLSTKSYLLYLFLHTLISLSYSKYKKDKDINIDGENNDYLDINKNNLFWILFAIGIHTYIFMSLGIINYYSILFATLYIVFTRIIKYFYYKYYLSK